MRDGKGNDGIEKIIALLKIIYLGGRITKIPYIEKTLHNKPVSGNTDCESFLEVSI